MNAKLNNKNRSTFKQFSKQSLNNFLSNYETVDFLVLSAHSNSDTKIYLKDNSYIGFDPSLKQKSPDLIKSEIKKSMPKILDEMLKEQKIKNLLLFGCKTGASMTGIEKYEKLIFKIPTDYQKIENAILDKNNQFNLARMTSKLYPGVYIWGTIRHENKYGRTPEYVVYYTDQNGNTYFRVEYHFDLKNKDDKQLGF